MKICNICKLDKEVSDFPSRSARCTLCHREYTRQHYQDNKQYYKDKAKRNTQATVEFVRKEKDKPCADCSILYPYYVMDFDHLGDKEFNISESVKKYGLSRLKTEIDKCDVVCANCHRIRTFERAQL